MADDLVSSTVAADLLGVTPETVRRWADAKKIRHVRLPSGQIKFHRGDLLEIVVPVEPEQQAG